MSYGVYTLTATVNSSTQVTLAWAVSASNNFTAAFSGPGTLSTTSVSNSAGSWGGNIVVTGLVHDTPYSWTMSLSGAAGTASTSSSSVTTQGYSAPNSVTLTVTPANSLTPTVSWSVSASGTTYPVTVTGVTVQRDYVAQGSGGASGTLAQSLANGTTYQYWIDYSWTSNGTASSTSSATVNYTTPSLYDVTYNANGGTGGASNQTGQAAGTTITVGSAPSRSGYTFNYWQASAAIGGVTNWSPGQTFSMPASTVAFTASWSVYVPPSYPPAWSDNALADGIVRAAYSDGVTATNMNYSGAYSISAGSLPPGLSLDTSTGAVTGTPTTIGSYSFTIKATNTYGNVSQAFTMNINGGAISVYNGTSWVVTAASVYNGSAWVTGSVYVYDGTNWVVAT
jgi:large repetitive protein